MCVGDNQVTTRFRSADVGYSMMLHYLSLDVKDPNGIIPH